MMADFCTLALTIMVCALILVVIFQAFGIPKLFERIAEALERKTVHGRWEIETEYDEFWGEMDYYKCTLCGHLELRDKQTPYCPNCGARMDGEG